MEKRYSPKEIEPKWQKEWEEKGIFRQYDRKKKFYVLDMFPYPSGTGLHVGHPKGYIATDVVARMKQLEGYGVLHPMGWDAFGLPAEQFAIKNKVHPKVATKKNIATYKKQMEDIGFTYDWEREIDTTDPEYYRWTQWIFLKMFEKGLAYESHEPINWCPSCQTGLANEDLEDGACERCGTSVEKKPMRQWVLRMTAYADRLLYDLDRTELEWAEQIKEQQRNWIGRSEGALVRFALKGQDAYGIEVFTTRVDTIFGCTYVVVAPEHRIVADLKLQIANWQEVEEYLEATKKKSDLERTELNKEKTGVKIEGIEAINPFTGEAVPVYVADYVLGSYGTGAVMAVPAHDERDFEFAKKHDLPIKQSVTPEEVTYTVIEKSLPSGMREEIEKIARLNVGEFVDDDWGHIWKVLVSQKKENDLLKLLSENIAEKKFYADSIGESNFVVYPGEFFRILTRDDLKRFKETGRNVNIPEEQLDIRLKAFVRDGILIDSGDFTGLSSVVAREKMMAWLKEKELGGRSVKYRMRDWTFSRQRYWGEPIPIVHCEKCGAVPVPEKDLPVRLPDVESYEPTGTGESPLADIAEWVNAGCPKCGGPAKRETNTMPQWAGSCWYYLRFIDPKNGEAFVGSEQEKEWMPVDLYVGGAEHATRHLLYARFWHKFLFDIGVVSTDEPFTRLVSVGLINASDGRKMSKRWGNVVNPDDIIRDFGADALRLYEMFMGPFTQNISWNTEGLVGTRRFLDKTWKLSEKVTGGKEQGTRENGNLDSLLHRTIKKVTEDINDFKFNTAVSSLMVYLNEIEKAESVSMIHYSAFLILLSPFAPHIAEELWHDLGNDRSIFLESWPQYDPEKAVETRAMIAVSVNGKVRDTISVPRDASEDDLKSQALSSEKVRKYTEGKEPKKVVVVPGRIVNIVI